MEPRSGRRRQQRGCGSESLRVECDYMWPRALVGLLLACAAAVPALHAQVDPELQRVRDLVRAGALSRNALAEAETAQLERQYREILRRTLLSETLQPGEIKSMLDAAKGLERIVRERFELTLMQVEAGVIPAMRLRGARDEFDAAKRQSELAETRANLVRQMKRMEATQSYRDELEGDDEVFRFYGFEVFEQELLVEIGDLYRETFGQDPPVSAEGDTDLHRSMGLDHTGRIDVAVHPDSDEGMFLTYMLESLGIPYFAFRTAIPGRSTGPHIHIGPPSDPLDYE